MGDTALVVEDSVVISLHIKKCLQRIGLKVIACVPSGEEALQIIDHTLPDIILMDIRLEGEMDGIDTAIHINHKADIPIIFLTAITDKNTLERAKGVLPYGYISKPFVEKELQNQVEITLFKSEKENELRASEEKFFTTINCIDGAIILINKNFDITFMNPSAEKLTGHVFQAEPPIKVFDVFRVKEVNTNRAIRNPFAQDISTKSFLSGESVYLKQKDGSNQPIGGIVYSSIYNYRKEFTGLVIYFNDHSEKLALEKEKREVDRKKITTLIEGQEMERKRVAREIHDGLGQLLNALKMNCELGIEEVKNDYFKRAVGMLQEAINETRRISENLLPSKLIDLSLSECIETLCQEVEKNSHIRMICHTESTSNGISDEIKIHLYRIVQESINNAIKHSGADEMKIKLDNDRKFLLLNIKDNGKGFNLKEKMSNDYVHHGLQNIIDRVKIMQGKIKMDSRPGKGFIIDLKVPVNNN